MLNITTVMATDHNIFFILIHYYLLVTFLLYMDIIPWAMLCVCVAFNLNAEFVISLVIFS
jgi:hypothetical protein